MHRYLALALFSAAVGVISIAACDGGDSTSGPGGGGSGGAGTGGASTGTMSTSGTTTSTVVSTSTGTGTFTCTDLLDPSTCGACVQSQCCQQLSLCLADEGCAFCYLEPNVNEQMCAMNDLYNDISACEADNCNSQCFAPCDARLPSPSNGACFVPGSGHNCNPVTNQGCAANMECGVNQDGFFDCFPPGNTAVCGACNGGDCGPGLVCAQGVCTPYCCDNGDCGASGKCVKDVFPDATLGICLGGPPKLSCEGGKADGTCDPKEDTCSCSDCAETAFCNPGQCKDDGACTVDDSCICADCDEAAQCSCNYDGACDAFTENCKCVDCWDEAECADNPKDPCVNDGVCGNAEFCTCPDCKDTAFCLDPNHCTEDGDCAPYEGCICNDCMADPNCQ